MEFYLLYTRVVTQSGQPFPFYCFRADAFSPIGRCLLVAPPCNASPSSSSSSPHPFDKRPFDRAFRPSSCSPPAFVQGCFSPSLYFLCWIRLRLRLTRPAPSHSDGQLPYLGSDACGGRSSITIFRPLTCPDHPERSRHYVTALVFAQASSGPWPFWLVFFVCPLTRFCSVCLPRLALQRYTLMVEQFFYIGLAAPPDFYNGCLLEWDCKKLARTCSGHCGCHRKAIASSRPFTFVSSTRLSGCPHHVAVHPLNVCNVQFYLVWGASKPAPTHKVETPFERPRAPL